VLSDQTRVYRKTPTSRQAVSNGVCKCRRLDGFKVSIRRISSHLDRRDYGVERRVDSGRRCLQVSPTFPEPRQSEQSHLHCRNKCNEDVKSEARQDRHQSTSPVSPLGTCLRFRIPETTGKSRGTRRAQLVVALMEPLFYTGARRMHVRWLGLVKRAIQPSIAVVSGS